MDGASGCSLMKNSSKKVELNFLNLAKFFIFLVLVPNAFGQASILPIISQHAPPPTGGVVIVTDNATRQRHEVKIINSQEVNRFRGQEMRNICVEFNGACYENQISQENFFKLEQIAEVYRSSPFCSLGTDESTPTFYCASLESLPNNQGEFIKLTSSDQLKIVIYGNQ